MISLPSFFYCFMIDSILTIWIASMTAPRANDKRQTIKSEGGSDEAAWLFSQQRGIPGQDRAEPQGVAGRSPVASPSQGRTVRARLSRHQPAGAGADAGRRHGGRA